MTQRPIHQPPPAPLVAVLVRAGLSQATVLAMEPWKAHEVLDLLRLAAPEALLEPAGPARGTI